MKVLNAVIAYKDFEWNDLAKEDLAKFLVITPNDIKTNLPNVSKYTEIEGYDNRIYGELSHHKYIQSNIDFDWIVVNQYRRRFELPDYHNIYVPKPMVFNITVKKTYSLFHNIEDLDLMTEIIMASQLDDSFKMEWLNSLVDNKMICYNMYSGPKDLYNKWINLSFELLDNFKDIRQFTSYEKIVEYYKNKNRKKNWNT